VAFTLGRDLADPSVTVRINGTDAVHDVPFTNSPSLLRTPLKHTLGVRQSDPYYRGGVPDPCACQTSLVTDEKSGVDATHAQDRRSTKPPSVAIRAKIPQPSPSPPSIDGPYHAGQFRMFGQSMRTSSGETANPQAACLTLS